MASNIEVLPRHTEKHTHTHTHCHYTLMNAHISTRHTECKLINYLKTNTSDLTLAKSFVFVFN